MTQFFLFTLHDEFGVPFAHLTVVGSSDSSELLTVQVIVDGFAQVLGVPVYLSPASVPGHVPLN